MRIALVSRESIWGGGEAFLLDVASELRDRGHEVLLRVPAGSELARRANGLPVVHAHVPLVVDFVVANDFRSLWLSPFRDVTLKRAFVVHGGWQVSPLRMAFMRALKAKPYVVSKSVEEVVLKTRFGKRPAVLPLGPSRVYGSDKPWPSEWGAVRTVGTVSRLDPIKRLELFGELVEALNLRGIIVCPPPKSSDEQSLFEKVSNFANIELRVGGSVEQLYKDVDIFLSTSRAESLGLAHLEALSAGLPTITTAAGGPRDFLTGELARGDLSGVPIASLPTEIRKSVETILSRRGAYLSEARITVARRGPAKCVESLLA